MSNREQMDELVNLLNECNTSYYINNISFVHDEVYDAMFAKLVELEKKEPENKNINSPTHRVGGGVSSEFNAVKHSFPMLSIRTETEPSLEKFEAWKASLIKQLQPLVQPLEFVVEYKFDGLGLSLSYENNHLVSGLTRGDGEFGEDVTNNGKTIHGVPTDLLHGKINSLTIRGEVMMPQKVFEKLNDEKRRLGDKPFANTRNAAAGSLRQLDSIETAKRNLIFVPYQIVELTLDGVSIPFMDQQESSLFMETLGFKTISLDEPIEKLLTDQGVSELAETKRNQLPFAIDGFVVKVKNRHHQIALGYRSREPNWAVAYKFQAQEAQTKLLSIDIQIGRTGKVTPVARLEPVKVGGTVVSNVTLHNVFDLRIRKVRVGDNIFIRRAGDVIPEISGYNHLSRTKYLPNFHVPKFCPSCNGEIKRMSGEREYYCTNSLSCKAQLKQSISHFVSRSAMDIKGFGGRLIDQLVDQGIIKHLSDVYSLSGSSFRNIEGFGDKSITNILKAIETSRTTTFNKFLYSLGIHNVGENTAKLLSTLVATPEALAKETTESLMQVKDIGPITAQSVYSFFKNENNYKQVISMWNKHLLIINPIEVSVSLFGKGFVVTGSFGDVSRDEIKQLIEENGGIFQKSASKKTHYLIAGEGGGGKKDEAEKLNITIISLNDFLNLINKD